MPILFGYNVERWHIETEALKYIDVQTAAKYSHARIRAGDLLTVRVGAPGNTAVVPDSLDGCHFASTMLIRGSRSYSARWLCYCMKSDLVQVQIDSVNYGAAQKQFNVSEAVNFLLPVSPLREQEPLAERLDEIRSSYEHIKDRIDEDRKLLQEYRQALITAAVTGQIDVRQEVNA